MTAFPCTCGKTLGDACYDWPCPGGHWRYARRRLVWCPNPPFRGALDAKWPRQEPHQTQFDAFMDRVDAGAFGVYDAKEHDKYIPARETKKETIPTVSQEAGEVVKAAIHCAEGREDIGAVRGEMRQLIAMLYRLWVEGDQVHGLPPVATAIERPAMPEGE